MKKLLVVCLVLAGCSTLMQDIKDKFTPKPKILYYQIAKIQDAETHKYVYKVKVNEQTEHVSVQITAFNRTTKEWDWKSAFVQTHEVDSTMIYGGFKTNYKGKYRLDIKAIRGKKTFTHKDTFIVR